MRVDNWRSKRFKLTGGHFDYPIINAQSVAVGTFFWDESRYNHVTDFSGTAIVNNIESRITLREWLIRAKSESRIQCGIPGRYLNLISESHPAFSFLSKNLARTSDYIRTFVRYYLNGLCEYFSTAVFCNRSGRRRRLFAIGGVRAVFYRAELSCEDAVSSLTIFVVDSGFTLSSDVKNPPIHDTSYCTFALL